MNKKVLFIVHAAVIAALYVVLTFVANAFGLANYAVQVRFSEALTILPFFTPAAIPGLTIGCLLSNILTGCALPDIILGTLASLLGAAGTYLLCNPLHSQKANRDSKRLDKDTQKSCHANRKWLAPIPPIVANTVIVPFVLLYAYGIRPLWLSFLTVGAGEIISCGILGMILLNVLNKYRKQIFTINE